MKKVYITPETMSQTICAFSMICQSPNSGMSTNLGDGGPTYTGSASGDNPDDDDAGSKQRGSWERDGLW